MKDFSKEENWILKEKYKGQKSSEYEADVIRLHHDEPLDYIIGHSVFMDATILLKGHPLIPRSETEFWVWEAIQNIKKTKGHSPLSILDAFAGSGCIGVGLLMHLPNIYVTFAEVDPTLLETIQENCKQNNIDEAQYTILQSNIFSSISGTFDYICANPPYVARGHKEMLPSSVVDFEPHLAIFTDQNGLFFIKKLLFDAPRYLKKNGVIYIEFDTRNIKEIKKLQQIYNDVYASFEIIDDQHKRPRVIKATLRNSLKTPEA